MKNRIYLDHAATTSLAPEVLEAMMPSLLEGWGNPSSVHGTGREARRAVEQARREIAGAIGAQPGEIYFTSGGSESDNWAIKGVAFASREKGNHIITSAIEHHAVLETCRWLEKQGFRVTYLAPDAGGRISPEALEKAITGDTVLISVMTANNEIGTLEPIDEMAALARARGIPFHTDAVQAVGAVPVSVAAAGVDLLSMSAHKFHGPKGIGVLYIRGGIAIHPLIHGGGQERGIRGGTENVPAIVGMGAAITRAMNRLEDNAERITRLRDRLIQGLMERIPGARLNGHPTLRLPNNCSISIPGAEGEALLLRMDLAGIACSSGSACTSGTPEPSHVLRAIGLDQEMAEGSLRLTLGEETTEEEIDEVLRVLPAIAEDLRSMRHD